jgi:hypothetical protein
LQIGNQSPEKRYGPRNIAGQIAEILLGALASFNFKESSNKIFP